MPTRRPADNPETLLQMLEADQVVAVKRGTRFGRRRLSRRMTLLLWALRIYVVVMLILVAITVVQAAHGG